MRYSQVLFLSKFYYQVSYKDILYIVNSKFLLQSSVILFDMLEYYESAKHLNISSNSDIGARGWQACSHMIKKVDIPRFFCSF